MATFRYELNGRPTKNKTYVIYLRVTIGGKRKLIKTPVEVGKPADFNAKCKGENWVRAGVRDSKTLNAQLSDILAKAKVTYKELDKQGEVSTEGLVKEMNTEVVSPSFIAFAKERAQIVYDGGGFRNWRKYNGLINKLEAFRKKRRLHDITMADLTPELLEKFDNFLHKWENQREEGKLLHPNTIQIQFNTLRAIVNKAVELGLLNASKNPFLVFKYKGVKTFKEKLEQEEIDRIIDLELEKESLLWHCRNYFLFSYYCAGIRAADLIQLRWRNITNARLHYQMGKNHKERDLILVDQAINILKFYKKEDSKETDYIFPLLSNTSEYASFITQADKDTMKPELRQRMYEDVSAKNALINKYLKKIAQKAEISKTLSMHISRHSFAYIAQKSGAQSSAIKNILGHSNLSTTERYMGSFDTSKTDETLQSLFSKHEEKSPISKEVQIIEMLKELSPEQIASIMNSLNK